MRSVHAPSAEIFTGNAPIQLELLVLSATVPSRFAGGDEEIVLFSLGFSDQTESKAIAILLSELLTTSVEPVGEHAVQQAPAQGSEVSRGRSSRRCQVSWHKILSSPHRLGLAATRVPAASQHVTALRN